MLLRPIAALAGGLLLGPGLSAAAPTASGSALPVEAREPALVRLKELLTSTDGQLKAPASPRFASLRDSGERGTRFVVGWLLPRLSADEAKAARELADALGRDGDGRLAAELPALGGRVEGTARIEDAAGAPLLVIAVASTRRGVQKELELAVLGTIARISEDSTLPFSALARRTLSPLARVVVEVHPPDAPRAAVRLPKPMRHVIERGDTLSEIAQSHGLELEALVRLNGVDPNKPIRPGDALKLDAGAPRPKLYVAKPGDTLGKVARHFGVTEKALLDVNRIEGRRLRPGQKLVLPR